MNVQHSLTKEKHVTWSNMVRRKEKQKQKKRTKRSFENTMKRISHLPVNLQHKIINQAFIEKEISSIEKININKDPNVYMKNRENILRRVLSERQLNIVMKRLHKNDFLKALKLKRKLIEHIKKTNFHEYLGGQDPYVALKNRKEFDNYAKPDWIRRDYPNNTDFLTHAEIREHRAWISEWDKNWYNYNALSRTLKNRFWGG